MNWIEYNSKSNFKESSKTAVAVCSSHSKVSTKFRYKAICGIYSASIFTDDLFSVRPGAEIRATRAPARWWDSPFHEISRSCQSDALRIVRPTSFAASSCTSSRQGIRINVSGVSNRMPKPIASAISAENESDSPMPQAIGSNHATVVTDVNRIGRRRCFVALTMVVCEGPSGSVWT